MWATLLAPMPQQEFFDRYWTKRFLHLAGPPTKFAHLFNWDVLNRCLDQHRFPPEVSPDRLGLVKAGKRIEASSYRHGDNVNANRLMKELADGATLILNFCEEIHPPLRDLCCHLEALFHVHVYVNMYAGWRKDNGFEIHWDDQDTLILQIHGRKHWKVWEATRACPFKRDIVDTSPRTKPDGPPVWEGILEQGGLLNIPRGWWHVAYPLDEPCLHLTVTIKNLNGIDLVHWLANELKASETVRKDVPVVAGPEERRAWLDAIRRDLMAACTDDLLEQYLRHVDDHAQPRPLMCLPQLEARPAIVSTTTPVQLARSRPLQFETTNGTAKFVAAGERFQIACELMPVLSRFNDGLPHTAAEVSPGAALALTAMLTMLVMKGVMRPVADRGQIWRGDGNWPTSDPVRGDS